MQTKTKFISDEEIRQIVVERIKALPSGRKISIGSSGDFSKDEMIDHVLRKDQIGDKIIQVQLYFLQSLKNGIDLDDE